MNLRRLFRRQQFETDLDAEITGYFQLVTDRLIAQGMSAEEARRTVRAQAEGTEQIKERVRDVDAGTKIGLAIRQVRFSLRALRNAPGFTALAVATLALGIGAATAVFSVVNTVLLKPLAYRNSGELMVASERVRFLGPDPVGPNPRHADLWQTRSTAFSGVTMVRQGARGLTLGKEHPRLVGAVTAYTNLFDVLEVTPFMGRLFTPDDGVSGRDNVAVVTYSLWQSMFLGDPHVVGTMIRVADAQVQVIGVLPADFHFPNANALKAMRTKQSGSNVQEPAIFLPTAFHANDSGWSGDYGNWICLGRLKPGFTAKAAETQLTSIGVQMLEQLQPGNKENGPDTLRALVQPMQEVIVGDTSEGLWLLMAAVLGLMLIGCVNLANAQLARALSRSREVAVRSALGATRWQLLWGSLSESLVLAVGGGCAGIALAFGALRLLQRYSPVDIPRLAELHVNGTVLLFALAISLGATLLFGALPALRVIRADPNSTHGQNSRSNIGTRQGRLLRNVLVGAQVFGCGVLLLLTGLFSKSLLHLLGQEKGFDSANIVAAQVDLPRGIYASDLSRARFIGDVLTSVRSVAGVESASMISAMSLEGESWIESLQRADRPNQENPLLNLRWVSPGYFETTRQRLVAGRFFEERDQNLRSVIVSEGEARAVWPRENPLGAQITMEGRQFTVIGVVADSRNTSLKSSPAKMAYADYLDRPPYSNYFLVRGRHRDTGLKERVRQAIWKLYPETTIARVTDLDSQVSASLSPERFRTEVLLGFGSMALLLAMLGIYAVLSYMVAERTQEIGVRMALGATRRKILALTLGESAAPVFGGLILGLAAGTLAARAVAKLLYGVQPLDWPVLAGIASLLILAATAAALVPARRAASIDPMAALRRD